MHTYRRVKILDYTLVLYLEMHWKRKDKINNAFIHEIIKSILTKNAWWKFLIFQVQWPTGVTIRNIGYHGFYNNNPVTFI